MRWEGQFHLLIFEYVFLNQISLFPVETYVRLNNKSIGQVLSTDQKQPLRPTIQLLYDGLGNRMEKQEVVRLSENPLLYIIDSIHEKDLPWHAPSLGGPGKHLHSGIQQAAHLND